MKLHTAIRGTLLIAAAASGLVWFVAWGAIHGWFPSLQRTLLLELANREGPYAVEVRAVGGSLVEGFVLEGLSLHAREDDGEQATASPIEVERARVELDLSHAYEQRHVIVRHLALEGVALRLEQTEAGGWQLQDLPLPSDPAARTETEPGTQAWRVSVDELLVREAEVSGRFGESGSLVARGTLVASDLAWPIPQERGPWSTLALDLRSLEGEFAAVRLRSGRLRVAGSPEHLDVHLEQASASAGERGQFHASGRASVDTTHDNPVIDDVEGLLAFSALDLAGLSSPLEGTTLPSTRLNGEIQLDQEEDWRVDFTLDASQIDSVAIKSARGHFDYTPETKAWRLTATQIDAEGSTVTARGHGTFDQIESLEIDAFDLPVAPFAAALGTSSHAVGNFDLVARLSGPPSDPRGRLVVEAGVELDARPPLDIGLELELEGQGHYTLGRIDLASDEPADFDLASTAPAKLVRENGTWHLRNLDLAGRHGGIQITRLRSDGTHHEIEAEFDQLDLAAVTRTFTPDSVIEGRLRGPLRFDSYGPHMTLTSELAFEAPRYGEFAVDRVVVSSASNERLWSFDARVEWGQALPIEINAVVPYAVA
ncbi:MAG: hypothetical protein GY944_28480, partial [bacterium]|nr:hypothetical protein [bacterium]